MKKGLLIYDRASAIHNEWFIKNLISKMESLGCELELVLAEDLKFGIKNSSLYLSKATPDFAIVRTIYPFLTLHLEKMGVRCFNSYNVSNICNNKSMAHSVFSAHDIKMMDTDFYDKSHFDINSADINYPCVLKSVNGHGGSEVFLINSKNELSDNLNKIDSNEFLLQQVCNEVGKDLRVYVVGKEIVVSVLRSSDRDFRSNFSLGGDAKVYTLSEKEKTIVNKIINVLDADMIGIDFIFDNGEMKLNEIEDVVGTRMIYHFTDIDIFDVFGKHILSKIGPNSR